MAKITPLPDYPQPFGSRNCEVAEYTGPANYQQTGDVLAAAQLGWGCIDVCHGGVSYSTTYLVRAQYGNNAVLAGNNVTLFWYFANGTQASNNANLSAEKARIQFFGS